MAAWTMCTPRQPWFVSLQGVPPCTHGSTTLEQHCKVGRPAARRVVALGKVRIIGKVLSWVTTRRGFPLCRGKDREREGEKERDAAAAKARSERKRERSAEPGAGEGRRDKKAPERERDSRSERGSRQAERKRSRSRSGSRDRDRDRERDRDRCPTAACLSTP